jgi:iron complex outermembrane receptor protein
MSLTPVTKTRQLCLLLSSLALTIAPSAFAQSQTTTTTTTTTVASNGVGDLSGTVLEPESGKYLVGAQVGVVGTQIGASTTRGGQFVLENVPAGPQQISVSYPGQDTKMISVTVVAGQTTTLPVSLGSEVVKLETFTVQSTKEGMAAAIASQQAATSQKLVEASDQYGDIEEGNAANYLKYLPGVNIEWNANDARAMGLRGLPTYLTNITFNGNPLASASSGNLNRRFEFEQTSLNDVATIDVFKTLTPDQQATSTAGSINFVPKSGFDRDSALLTYQVYENGVDSDLYLSKQPSYSATKTYKIWPGGILDYSDPVNDKFAFDISVSESEIYNDYPRVTYGYQVNPAFGATPQNPYFPTWDITEENKLTKRQQLSGTFDWHPTPGLKIQLSAGWSWYWLVFEDRDYTFTIGNLAALPAGVTVPSYAGTDTVTSAPGKGKIGTENSERWKFGTTYDVNLPVSDQINDNLSVTTTPYWTQSYSKYRDSQYGNVGEIDAAISSITTTMTNVGTLNPGRIQSYDPAGLSPVNPQNLGGYSLVQVRLRPQTGYDTWSGGPADVKYKFDTQIPITLDVGYRYDDHVRQDAAFLNTLTTFPAGTNTGAAVSALQDTVYGSHNVGYGIGGFPWLSPYKALAAFPINTIPAVATSSDTYGIWNEYTKAPYVMGTTTLWDRLLIVAGVRYEQHTIDSYNRLPTGAIAATATTAAVSGQPASARMTDKRYYPSINLKYDIVPKTFDVRFGAAKSLGLPDYGALLPTQPTVTDPTASSPTGTISVYNPNLKPYVVYNYDLSAEYYINPAGLFTASVYHKQFNNYIINFSQQATPALLAQYGAPTPPSVLNGAQSLNSYVVNTTQNINDASGTYNGFELDYKQTLTFLPQPFNAVSVQANWSRLFVGGIHTHEPLSAASTQQNAALQQLAYEQLYTTAVTNEFNFVVSDTYKKLNAMVAFNYTGASLLTDVSDAVAYTGQTGNFYIQKTMFAPYAVTNVRLEYRASRRVTPYFQVYNLFNRPQYNTIDGHMTLRAQYGDPTYEVGIRGVW